MSSRFPSSPFSLVSRKTLLIQHMHLMTEWEGRTGKYLARGHALSSCAMTECQIFYGFLGKHRAQEIDRETALQTSQNEETDRIPFILTYHPQNLAIKNVILKNFKILRNDPETKHIFSLPPLISFKRDKNLGNFLVRSAFKLNNQPGTFTCKRTQATMFFAISKIFF